MARILSRPMFRKGGLSKAPRPSYRGGGVTTVRPGYRGGGRMTGIMSGIVDRRPYKTGSSWYKPWSWNMFNKTPLTGGSPNVPALYKKPLESRIASKIRGAGRWLKGLPGKEGIAGIIARNFPKTAAVMEPIIPHYIAGKGALAQKKLIDKASEKGLLDEMDFEYVDGRVLPTEETVQKIDPYKTPKQREMEASMEKPEISITESDIDTKVTGDVESDLMRAYKEYAPIFEKELGVSPEDTKKQLWLQAAKQGFGLAGDPGGDLIGAIGKRAEKGIEGAEKIVSDVSTAKRQAKLLALQTAIREGEPGQIGKAVKDIAKIYKDSQEEAAAIYEKWQRNDTTARAATNKRYAEQAEKLGLVKDNQNRFIAEANEIANKHPELIGQFNNKLPEDPDDWEVGGYYVTDTGRLIRVVEQEGKKVRIGMNETGFSDKKKNKK